jgi:hypothetical protein
MVFVRDKETEMAPMTVNIESTTPVIEHCLVLPKNRNEWSSGARTAYREVLGELEVWSRRQDLSKSLNSWIAEEAIRQSW